jgi:predicted enzyme related to lactoylglutathione lyase
MLSDCPAYATLPTADIASLRSFYENTLGFTPRDETPAGVHYRAGEGTYFAITLSSGRAAGSHTQMAFAVPDIQAEVGTLRARGAVFEAYETPKTVDGIADMPGVGRAAWLRDPDGNLIGLFQLNRG